MPRLRVDTDSHLVDVLKSLEAEFGREEIIKAMAQFVGINTKAVCHAFDTNKHLSVCGRRIDDWLPDDTWSDVDTEVTCLGCLRQLGKS